MKYLSILPLLLVAQINFTACQNKPTVLQGVGGKLAVNDFEQKLNTTSNAQLVDVRTPEEFNGGHISYASNIDWNGNDFEKQIQKLDKTKPTFVYCMAGGRSASAMERMKGMGFKEVYDLEGGMLAWNNSGKPLVTDEKPRPNGMNMEEYTKQVTSDKLVLVDFNAPWCSPCKKLAPVLETISSLKKDQLHLLKLNVDENKELTKTLQVENIPVLLLYKNGKEVWKFVGLPQSEQIMDAIEANQ